MKKQKKSNKDTKIYKIGQHILVNGDSTDPALLNQTLDNNKISLY